MTLLMRGLYPVLCFEEHMFSTEGQKPAAYSIFTQ